MLLSVLGPSMVALMTSSPFPRAPKLLMQMDAGPMVPARIGRSDKIEITGVVRPDEYMGNVRLVHPEARYIGIYARSTLVKPWNSGGPYSTPAYYEKLGNPSMP